MGRRPFTMTTAYITTIICFVGVFFYCKFETRHRAVIDLDNKLIFNETRLFSFTIRTKKTPISEIIQIGNNISPTNSRFKIKGSRGGKEVKPDPETKLFYNYYISFLLKNGKTQNILIGPYEEDYETSVKITKMISEYFDIPQIVCNKGNVLTSREYFNSYKFEENPFSLQPKKY